MYLFVHPKQKTRYGSAVVSISNFLPAVWCRKLPHLSPGLGRAYKQGERRRGLYPGGRAYIWSKKKPFQTSYSTFEFTRIFKLQNVVEIPIFISMQARSRVLSRIYCLEEKCQVAEGHEFPDGSEGVPPRKFFEMNMRWDTIWCILRQNFKKCYRGILFLDNTPCSLSNSVLRRGTLKSRALTSSRLHDFFQYSYLYSVMITIFFWGKLGILGGETSTPQTP